MIEPYEARSRLMTDEDGYYRLYHRNRRPFAATVVQSKHVGLYLMGVHVSDEIYLSLSPGLRARMSGKSFRFKDEDDPVLGEVPGLLEACWHVGEN